MTERKNPKIDVRKYRGLFFNIGLVAALGLVLTAFEWKTPIKIVENPYVDIPDDVTVLEIPVTDQPPPPPPPKIKDPVINEVSDDIKIEDVRKVVVDLEPEEKQPEPLAFVPEPVEKPEEIFTIVENQPKFMNGGQEEFLKYVGSKLKYPTQAKRMGIEGKVFVQFVVDKNGKMTDIEVIRGIGAGCDEEVLRVLKGAPEWEPGKQRGMPVKVRMIVPVTFKLQ